LCQAPNQINRRLAQAPLHFEMPERPPRLARIFDHYDPPLYFVTFNTHQQRRILANPRTICWVYSQGRSAGHRNRSLRPDAGSCALVCPGTARFRPLPVGPSLKTRIIQVCSCRSATLAKGILRPLDPQWRELRCKVGIRLGESGARWACDDLRFLAVSRRARSTGSDVEALVPSV
jgi:hypothetical protein